MRMIGTPTFRVIRRGSFAAGAEPQRLIATGAPATLIRRGGDKKTLAIGTEIIVEGWLARDGSKTVNGRVLKFADGREILAGTSNASAQ
jgi:hypothetical protein